MLLVFPDNLTGESPMTWQVIDGMRYSMVDEADRGATPRGPEKRRRDKRQSISPRQPPFYRPGPFDRHSSHDCRCAQCPPRVGSDDGRDSRHARSSSLERVPSVTTAAALITAATGQLPVYQKGSWVWTEVNLPPLPLSRPPPNLRNAPELALEVLPPLRRRPGIA